MQKTLKTKIYVDSFTAQYCERAFGVRRWVWNWTLSRFFEEKKRTGYQPKNWYGFDKELRQAVKAKKDKGFEWLAEHMITSNSLQEAAKDVQDAFTLCKNKKVQRRSKGKARPHFKSRKDAKQSFRIYHSLDRSFKVESEYVISFQSTERKRRCRFRTTVPLTFLTKPGVKLTNLIIKREGGDLWACISYEIPNHTHLKPAKHASLGIDLGVVKSVVSYDGNGFKEVSFNTPRSMKLDKLSRKMSKRMSRCKRGSRRYNELLRLQQSRAARAARIRNYNLEVYTTFLVQNYDKIVVDDFSFDSAVALLHSKKKQELYNCMKYHFKLRLGQKAAETGTVVSEVNHRGGQKTTRLCSCCGSTHVKIPSKTREVLCPNCGQKTDRDRNAAVNAFKLA